MLRPLWHRAQEWLADRVSWVQYPRMRLNVRRPWTLQSWWGSLTGKERGWVYFAAFWGSLIALSIWGNVRG